MLISTIYLKQVFDPELFQLTVSKTLAGAEYIKRQYNFDTIAFCGVSGAAMAFLIAHAMKLPTLCVRKEDDASHYRRYRNTPLEGNMNTLRYLILDDFISSGNTVNYIIDCITKELPRADCVAMLMYSEPHDRQYQHATWSCPVNVIASKPEQDYSYERL